MTYKIRYLPEAFDELMEIALYLAEHSSQSAMNFFGELEVRIENLGVFPKMYPVYKNDDYFRMMPVIYDYQVYYHLEEEIHTVEIHHILHGKRDVIKFLKETRKSLS